MVHGIVVAGGQGTRIGFQKQFAQLAGKAVWRRSAEALRAGGVARIWLAVPEADVERLCQEISSSADAAWLTVTAGGNSRFESVRNALAALLQDDEGARCDFVAVHDAARPFVHPDDVRAVIAAARSCGGAILAVPSPDTVKSVRDGRVVHSIPREQVWLAQTPQVFALEWMRSRYFSTEPSAALTDDASLFENASHEIHVVPATQENRKITTPADWAYAQWLAAQRWGGV
ncbi:2-C-methyl-D-erythritol 4-phosphate cytidylyltransferase [Alicyclobacillus contaminans]|uniref:IspD/TarI family cytidylyltransferase n=1 Tax=Alicyclobacillus contaminans TaxID=392016 RepID=UPI00040DE62C|nr:IspD/TarI family cytidylyltransferase [Alicyclobacillus contaminans]GMA50487.1 2-C-methyl-D-erythritol 4-phosphate cytidylyltransferase [Alicyclobacillus contaminans]